MKRPRRPGIHAHRLELAPGEITLLRRLPITTPARTLLDVSAVAGRRELENALARALTRGLTDRSHLRVLLDRHPRRRGTRKLSVLLQPGETAAFTRSKAEERFLELIQRAQLPAPELNVSVCGHEVDFYWRAVRLVVEIDGFAFHSSAEMFESDRRRDAVLIAAGVRVIRATWHQLEAEREALVARLAQALARSAKE